MAFYIYLKYIPGLVAFQPASGSFHSNDANVFILIFIVIKHPILYILLNVFYEKVKETFKQQHLNSNSYKILKCCDYFILWAGFFHMIQNIRLCSIEVAC